MRPFIVFGLGCLVALGGCVVFGDFGTDLTVPDGGASTSTVSTTGSDGSGASIGNSSGSAGLGGQGGAGGVGGMGGGVNTGGGGGAPVCGSFGGGKEVEICNVAGDEDGNGKECTLKALWTNRFGGLLNQSVVGVHLDKDGVPFFTGTAKGLIELPVGNFLNFGTAAGFPSAYVAKLDENGAGLWIAPVTANLGVSGAEVTTSLTNVYSTGGINTGAMMIGTQAYLKKWATGAGVPAAGFDPQWGGSGEDFGVDVAYVADSVNGDGLFSASTYQGSGDHPCDGTPNFNAPNQISVIKKHNLSDGACLSATIITGTADAGTKNSPAAIAPIANSGVVVAGGYIGTIDLAGAPASESPLRTSVYIARLANDAKVVWHKEILTDSGDFNVLDVAVSPANARIFVVGKLKGELSFGGNKYTSEGDDAIVVAFSQDGVLEWIDLFHGPGAGAAHTVAVQNGSVYVAGVTDGTMQAQANAALAPVLCADNTKCVFLMKIEPECGAPRWARVFGEDTTGTTDAKIVKLGSSAAGLLLGVTWTEDIEFANADNTPAPLKAGGTDIVLAKFTTLP